MRFSHVVLTSLCLALMACASSTLTGNKSEPEWVAAPQPGGERLFGHDSFYGRGKSTLADLDTALSEAQDEARSQVGAVLQSEIERVSEKTQDAVTTVASEGVPEQKKALLTETIKKTFKNSDKNIVKVALKGSTVMASWRDKETGTTWALARINKDQAQRAMISEFQQAANAALTQSNTQGGGSINQKMVAKVTDVVTTVVKTALTEKTGE
ncbi:hypothetical protein WDW37_08140 [Bdellovibrionota bacterium FG-1]